MRICSKCGSEIKEDAKFCTTCGQPLADTAFETTTETKTESVEMDYQTANNWQQTNTSYQSTGTEQQYGGAAQSTPNQQYGGANQQYQYDYTNTTQSYGSDYDPTHYSGMGIAGFVLAFFVPVLGIIFSAIGLSHCKNRGYRGRGLALAGLILSIVFIAIAVLITIAGTCAASYY